MDENHRKLNLGFVLQLHIEKLKIKTDSKN